MEIGKAEEIVSLYIKEHLTGPLTPEALDFREALMLVLKRIRDARDFGSRAEVHLLPGETNED